ncbi:zinc-binding dehydrogenase [Mycobacterium branderi]|uniref:Alcohol dehydrogenase n=1 Tax=Mycobacterium branderi TaxID=43348 RepID=A0A7I7WHX8_9MYCO|nr:zinc-binding dehydrogenase [Mycobacterium branderi]MCV7231866.1 alcohol dehydrogenase catalytic domain-containing protein [Mycobacterium branderi]ORA40190.1 hypothetical protein BST20_06370 [Mycobacterium branderi]BBZ15478.1 alcohol dehydrogenase [Mycobacterium branderi]
METTAAVLWEANQPLSVEQIELDAPGEGEVLLRMVAAGVCYSDHHFMTGRRTMRLPAVIGHEGAGIVEAVGPGVKGVSVGDHVVQTFVAPCGRCYRCRRRKFTYCEVGLGVADGTMMDGTFRMHRADRAIGTGMRLGSFSQFTVSPETACVVVPSDIDLIHASLVSCGISTGVGAAVNVAAVRAGDSVAVFGAGGVGAAAIAGAIAAGAAAVIAIDIADQKLEMARSLGATHAVNARDTDSVRAVRQATGGYGVDKSILCIDVVRPEHLSAAIDCLDSGGTAVVVGAAESQLDHIPTSPALLMRDSKSVVGTMYGGMDPHRDVLRYLELYRAGRLPLEKFVSKTYPLESINESLDDLIAGRNIRGVVVF